MVNFGTSIVPIVVAIITVTLSPLFAIAISNLTSHNPIVSVLITPNYNNDGRKAIITLTNNGSAPASNVSLTISSPKKITEIINNFSAASISLPQLPSSNNSLSLGIPKPIDPPTLLLQIKIPKLVHGEGSLTKLQILNNGNPHTHYDSYTGVVIYDQGSSLAKVKTSTKPTITEQLSDFFERYGYDNLLAYFLAALPLSYLTIYAWYLYRYKPRRNRRDFMRQVLDKILSIYHSLNMDPMSDMKFDEFRLLWKNKYYYTKDGLVLDVDLVKDIKFRISAEDYIYIDKLYIKLQNRKPDLKDDELKTYNHDCARLAEDALIKIPWKNYI